VRMVFQQMHPFHSLGKIDGLDCFWAFQKHS
jgi:hypothetical protein